MSTISNEIDDPWDKDLEKSWEATAGNTDAEKIKSQDSKDRKSQPAVIKQHRKDKRRSLWWGDVVPRADGMQNSRIRISAVEFANDRGQWSHEAEFILSCMGMSVGLGNVWRFPYLAYKNGGAAFLLVYIILQLSIGEAIYFMELTVTQFSGRGPTKVWDMCPAAKGIGFAMCLISANIAIYYNVIMSYTLIYFFNSFRPTLPWTVCRDEWTNCVSQRYPRCTLAWLKSDGRCTCTGNATIDISVPVICAQNVENATTSSCHYFYKDVIHRSPGLEPEHLGTPLPRLTFCLFLTWLIVMACLFRGIKSSGKVVYFTVTLSYVILLALLVRGVFLHGAWDGLKYFLIPTWSKIGDANVWGAAASQMLFSLSVAQGPILMFGSYNKFDYPVYVGSLLAATVDSLTSIVGGFVVFSTFGAMAKIIGSTVEEIAISGYGLAFIVFPEALSKMPLTHVWSVLVFFMLYTLGLDSQLGLCETVLTSLYDEIPRLRKKKSICCLCMGVIGFLLALPCVCPGGDYVVTLMDHYGANFTIIFVAFIEVVAIMYGYGVNNVLKDLEYMLGSKPPAWQYWYFCWVFSCPLILAYLFIHTMVNDAPLKYASGEPYPLFAQTIGWLMFVVIICPIPIMFFYRLYKTYTMPSINTKELRKEFLFKPSHNWIPNDGRAAPEHVVEFTPR